MPYIGVKTTMTLTPMQQEKIKCALGEKLPLIPGKTEKALMVDFSGEHTMYLSGEKRELAFLDVRCYRSTEFENKKAFTEAVFDIMNEVTGLPKDAMYLCYGEYECWGLQGSMK